MSHDQEAVQRVDLVGGSHEIENGLGRNSLSFRRATRQWNVGRVRRRERGK
jgi:hypothetical protein